MYRESIVHCKVYHTNQNASSTLTIGPVICSSEFSGVFNLEQFQYTLHVFISWNVCARFNWTFWTVYFLIKPRKSRI